MNIVWAPSQNYSPGRGNQKVDKIIIHWADATLDQAVKHFQVDGSKPPYNGVSAHFIVEDERVVQCVKLENTSWHAGNFLVNQQSIGIEHSADPFRPASDATYATSGALIAQLCKQLGLSLARGLLHPHKEFKATACPGTMDLDRIFAEAEKSFNSGNVSQFSGYDQSVAPGIPAVEAVAHIEPTPVVVDFQVTVSVASANFRTAPSLNAPVARSYPRGTVVQCNASTTGDNVTANGRTSNVWYHSSLHGFYISSTVCDHN